MDTQNSNTYIPNTNGNTSNPIVSLNQINQPQINQAFSLTKPYQPKQLDDFNHNNDSSTQLANLSEVNLTEANTLTDLSTSNDNVLAVKSAKNKDSEEAHNSNKKGKKAKLLTTKSENAKTEFLESEQLMAMVSFPISPKEKKQIEAVAILSGHESAEGFIAKLVSDGMKPYLDAVTQALNKA